MMKPWNFRRFWYRWSWNCLLPVWNLKDGWQQDGKSLLMNGLYFLLNGKWSPRNVLSWYGSEW